MRIAAPTTSAGNEAWLESLTGPPMTEAGTGGPPGRGGAAPSEILVALLRASLATGDFPDAARLERCDWPAFARLANHHGLTPVVYRALRGRTSGVPAHWLRQFGLQYLATVLHTQVARTNVEEIGAAFHDAGLSVVVMKGAALVRTLYDDPGLRVLGDIDLLVDEREVERAGSELGRLGLQPIESGHADHRGPLCHIHHLYCRPGPRAIPVELHWRLFEPYQPYVFDLTAVRAQARPLPGLPPNVLSMAPGHELAHLCVHLDRHAVTYRTLLDRNDWFEQMLLPQGQARLLWLYDIARFLQRHDPSLDWDGFVDTARHWAIDGRVHATLELCRRLLGVGPPPEVLRALSGRPPRWVERVAHRVILVSQRANERRESGPAGARRARRLALLSGHILRLTNSWISVFPSSAYLRARYASSGARLRLRCRHLREVVPGLWAEARDRWRSGIREPLP